ncbi:glycosyltransferase [Paenibacillus sp. SYP-B3998]|uniref:Glycosyltransferase n=1 Tax=Paenibacillus sp. SYP-B3998 TaxID=2678564 RepID=A0A6G3ZUB8_9BACL|nr:glycosyltransferase [Paenibacillus sp. SYP-B3998]NEW05660.1 glycosyltransferase [Paenibacillus sp. SYP-B3998]
MFSENRYRAAVIIPTYNRAELLRHTLRSLIHQTLNKDDFETIIVDDGSSDHTKEVISSFESELHIKYVYQPDQGFRVARARNLGIKLAEASICIFIDSGLLLSPDCLWQHVHTHVSSSELSAVIGYVAGFSQHDENNEILMQAIDLNDWKHTMETVMNDSLFEDIREGCYRKYNDKLTDLPAPWVFFWAGNVSVPTSILKEIQGFDEQYTSWGVEDVDVGYALFLKKVRFQLRREALTIHFPHDKDEHENKKNSQANRTYFHNKYKSAESELLITTRCLDMNDVLLQGEISSK